jgi:hypothetical protein
MAIYHLSVKPISRSGGRSATAAAAYRSAEKIYDRTSGEIFDYTRKRGVEHSEIVLPASAAKRDINWARDRQALWNAAEVAENRKDSRVAREYEVALPHELTKQQRLELTRTFATQLANKYGCAVDYSIHKPHRAGDERNHHAHILATTRVVEPLGLGAKTEIEWKDSDRAKRGLVSARHEITTIRENWALLTNHALQHANVKERVDHRTLEAQGIEREPTIHLGPTVTALQRRGITTQVEKRLEWEAREIVQERLQLAAELGQLAREQKSIEKSIIELSTDVAAAKRDRDKTLSMADRRQNAAERWLEYRERQKEIAKDPSKAKDKDLSQELGKGKGRGRDDDDFSM